MWPISVIVNKELESWFSGNQNVILKDVHASVWRSMDFIRQKFEEQSAEEVITGGHCLPAGEVISGTFLTFALRNEHYSALVHDSNSKLQPLKLAAFEVYLYISPKASESLV
jgi:hypothetical protein